MQIAMRLCAILTNRATPRLDLIGIKQEKINISVCVNGIPYINGARKMGMHERIASVT